MTKARRIAQLMAGISFFLCFGSVSSEAREQMDKKTNQKSFGEKYVRAKLKDPESARFQNQFVTKTGNVCGEVNAKNSFGGYSGFHRYIFIPPDSVILESADKDKDMGFFEQVYWNTLCK